MAACLQTSLGALTITPAQPAELSIVMEILDDAAAWLHSKGITGQWDSPIPVEIWKRRQAQIAQGEVYLARLADGSVVGILRFDWSDAELWPDDPDGGGYVHSFAIRNSVRGHQIGAAMIAWAKQHVLEHGKAYLRLDCWGENPALCKYYAGLGFTFCGMVRDEDGPNALFQMEA